MRVRPLGSKRHYALKEGLEKFRARLKPGQILQGRILDLLPGKRFVARFQGFNLIAESELPFRKGEAISVRVKELGPKIVLQYLLPFYPGETQEQDRFLYLRIPLRDARGEERVAEVGFRRKQWGRKGRGGLKTLVRLVTPNLGLVEAELEVWGAGIGIKFWVEDEVVQGLFQECLKELKEKLEDGGYRLSWLGCLVFGEAKGTGVGANLKETRLFDVTA